MGKPRARCSILVAALVPFAFSAAAPSAFAQEPVGESALTQIHALEQQKLELLMRARQNARSAARGRGKS